MLQLILPHLLTILGLALGLILIVSILRQRHRPAVSIAWFLAIILIPYLGVPAYLLFGGRKLKQKANLKTDLYEPLAKESPVDTSLEHTIETILMTAGMPPARSGHQIEFFGNGQQAYQSLMGLLEGASQSINIMTFILGRDDTGRSLIDLLSQKAKQGVEVRLLLDALGCFLSRGRFADPVRRAGGKVGIFLPVLPWRRRWSANLRNHRKIVIVDGQTAWIGGMNLAREYMGAQEDPDSWVDSSVIVRGPVVKDLERIFANDWEFATDEYLVSKIENKQEEIVESNQGFVQAVASGPDVVGDPLYEAILMATYETHRRVWIVSPYFVPDEGLFRALMLQCRLGRDVRIVLPERSNHLLADIARDRFLRQLKKAGARIFLYKNRMVHAKHLIFDDNIAMVGSMNLDMRSLYLNYEAALLLYSSREIKKVSVWISELMDAAVEMKQTEASSLRVWIEDLALLISPLL